MLIGTLGALHSVSQVGGIAIPPNWLTKVFCFMTLTFFFRRRRNRRLSDKDSLSTANSQSRAPSNIIPRINTQNYRNFKADQSFNNSYDPAFYNAKEQADRDLTSFAYDNATYRCK